MIALEFLTRQSLVMMDFAQVSYDEFCVFYLKSAKLEPYDNKSIH